MRTTAKLVVATVLIVAGTTLCNKALAKTGAKLLGF